ncbi:MAG TPA: putative lipopolysaccharide heptosyltransferase III [Thermodesulfovibrionales bacterium]|nr:putative lipopolysaccharide heptosyltransferase III [Thermodesulfovibrionales bacterium]
MNFQGVRKILVIKLRHIGDVLLAVPVFRALREHFGDAHISALVNSGTEDVLSGNPLINEILLLERNVKGLSLLKRYVKEIGFLKQVRARGVDMTVDLTGGDRAAILSLVSGARYRLGWMPRKGFPGKRRLYTHLSLPEAGDHMVLQNLDVVSDFGIDTQNLSVDFHIPEKDRAVVRAMLKEHKITESDSVVHIHPTSRWLFKCWKDEYMVEVIGWLVNQGLKVVVTSSRDPKEINKAKKIVSLVSDVLLPHIPALERGGTGGMVDLCGTTTIKQLAAVSDAADLFFGVDSAPMHIAAAVGTPVVALFGPSGAFHWGPWDNGSSLSDVQSAAFKSPYLQKNGIQTFGIHTVIQREWGCIPCGSDGCEGTKISKCLDDISAGEVIDVLREKLGKH